MARPKNSVEWSIYLAAQEFAINERTLNTRLAGTRPAFKDKYSTPQIVKAVFGDISGAKLRKLNAEAEAAQIAVEKSKSVLVEAADIDARMRAKFIAVKQKIQSFEHLTQDQRDDLLHGLHSIYSSDGRGEGGDELAGVSPQLADSQTSPAA